MIRFIQQVHTFSHKLSTSKPIFRSLQKKHGRKFSQIQNLDKNSKRYVEYDHDRIRGKPKDVRKNKLRKMIFNAASNRG